MKNVKLKQDYLRNSPIGVRRSVRPIVEPRPLVGPARAAALVLIAGLALAAYIFLDAHLLLARLSKMMRHLIA
jgi:hypothetical protein